MHEESEPHVVRIPKCEADRGLEKLYNEARVTIKERRKRLVRNADHTQKQERGERDKSNREMITYLGHKRTEGHHCSLEDTHMTSPSQVWCSEPGTRHQDCTAAAPGIDPRTVRPHSLEGTDSLGRAGNLGLGSASRSGQDRPRTLLCNNTWLCGPRPDTQHW